MLPARVTAVEQYAKSGLRRAGKGTADRIQQSLDDLIVPGAEAV